jgi:hypothetical protein
VTPNKGLKLTRLTRSFLETAVGLSQSSLRLHSTWKPGSLAASRYAGTRRLVPFVFRLSLTEHEREARTGHNDENLQR